MDGIIDHTENDTLSIQSFIEEPVKVICFNKGEMIYKEGTAPRYFYEVKYGEVKVVNSNDEGNDFIQAVYKTGGIFGAHLLFCDKLYPASAFAANSIAFAQSPMRIVLGLFAVSIIVNLLLTLFYGIPLLIN